MPALRRGPVLPPGVYDEVVSDALAAALARLSPDQRTVLELEGDERTDALDAPLLGLIRDATRIALADRTVRDKVAVVGRVLELLAAEGGALRPEEHRLHPQLLRAVAAQVHDGAGKLPQPPRGLLSAGDLLTNAHGERVIDHLESEFDSADRVDLLCAFIKLSGLDRLRAPIERHRQRGRPLRVLTTTYMRATEQRAVEWLRARGAEVRISYDDSHTRLHAKAWLFHRDSGYSVAYVGSSNLSHAAQTEGLEWNVRLAAAEQPRLVEAMSSVFDGYWADADRFEPFDGSPQATARLGRALREAPAAGPAVTFDLEPKSWQRPILRELEERRAAGQHHNLVVAATGTGKTLIAAFDFERLYRAGAVETLLFVAHRKEILQQARDVFRQVLRQPSFGELWVDGRRPVEHRHVFASIQSLDPERLDPAHYHYVLIDEVHHAAAPSYDALLARLVPRERVGLTATPERADGRLYDRYFPRPYVGNLRLWDAIPSVLVPFRYFVLDVEGVDLTDAKWSGGYVDAELSGRLITAAALWVRTVARALRDRVARPERVRGLAFCVDKAHAAVVAERLQRDVGLAARVLTEETPSEERSRAKEDLACGRVQVLCVVDLFNEGVDLPDVNTLFLFRPTESATVFLQQLGRGLRRSRDKDVLTVFDVTGRQHPRFRFDRHLRGLLGHTPRELRQFVGTGHGRLPSGCSVELEERSREDLLQRLERAIPTDQAGMLEVLRAHAGEGWSLATFLEETEVELADLYREHRSWTWLRAQVEAAARLPEDPREVAALAQVGRLITVDDPERLAAWARLAAGEAPRGVRERRLMAMLFVQLYPKVGAPGLDALLETWRGHRQLRAEVGELVEVLLARADAPVVAAGVAALPPEVPLALHARYHSRELAAAFHTTTPGGDYRTFYSGVAEVANGAYDLLLVTLDKEDVAAEHLKYRDHPLSDRLFHWESQAKTLVDSPRGRRHLTPAAAGVTPLLFVRPTKKDDRGLTAAFHYLGPVTPERHRGERPIAVEWRLAAPLRAEWVRRWGTGG